jgi:DNA modification methylase
VTVTLYHGDCLEVLKTLEPGSVDAVVTDPPYGIKFKYATHDDTPEGYGEWIWSIAELAESKLKPGSPMFVFQAMLNVRKFAEWFPRDWRLFAACKNFVQMRKVAMQYAFDPVLVWWTDGDRYSEGTLSRDWHIGNTANTLNRGTGDAGGHPCARPLDQIAHIVNQWVRPSGLVLDPFMGSGTTGVACVQTGRNFIGIEIDRGYYEIAERRIAEAQAQMRMEL